MYKSLCPVASLTWRIIIERRICSQESRTSSVGLWELLEVELRVGGVSQATH